MPHTHFAPIFTDHLVLQREKPIRLWGTCTPGASLNIILCEDPHFSSREEPCFSFPEPQDAVLSGNDPYPQENYEDAPSSPSHAFWEESGSALSKIRLISPEEHFLAELPAQCEGGPYKLFLLEDDRVCQVINDVMIGEVWLAGGQSNMEYELGNDADAADLFSAPRGGAASHGQLKDSVASEKTPPAFKGGSLPKSGTSSLSPMNVRFYQVMRASHFEEGFFEKEAKNHWMTADDPMLSSWSAVAFHFARELSETLGCCVGIIGCNWGGTSASAWQDWESLLAHPQTAVYWEEYRDIIDNQSPEEYEKARREYAIYQESWQPKINEFYSKNPSGSWADALSYAGPCLWPGPMGPKHEFRPCGLYETMLRRVTPYSLRGFLYYQGESDDHRPDAYYTLLRSMLRVWRRDFKDEKLYFLNVQLPMHRYESDPPSDSWSEIRQAQLRLHREDPLSGLAVAIDLGEFNNIHPLHKKEVGHRLFLQSMTHVYHILSPKDAYGPLLRRAVFSEGTRFVQLEFDYAEAGFDRERYCAVVNQPHDNAGTFLQGFEVAGPDGIYHPAEADFQTGDQTVSLRLPGEVSSPASVRYLWTNYSLVPLFDRKGMPAAPFRILL